MILHIKDIERNVFFSEDRNDWLSAQRRREAGKRFTGAAADVRQSHRERCDAEEVAREHHNDCAAQQVARNSRAGTQQQDYSQADSGPTLIKVIAIIIGILVAISMVISLIGSFAFDHYVNDVMDDVTAFDNDFIF